MTFWESTNNYGQILQLFALSETLKRKGHDPFLIKFYRIPPNHKKKVLASKFNLFQLLDFVNKLFVHDKDEIRKFNHFKSKYLSFGNRNYYSLDDLKRNPPKADMYIVGSDQVWNNNFSISVEPFLLGFGNPGIKRVAYAASFGVSDLDTESKKIFLKYLKDFDAISVRERSGVGICNDLGSISVDWVLDPTMLFTKENWFQMLNISDSEPNNTIFIYTLGHSSNNDKDRFISHANQLEGFSVIHASANNDGLGGFLPTIEEWIGCINNSSFVVTTSFHGVVFCLLCKTNFVVLPSQGNKEGMNERIDSLLGLVELKDHIAKEFSAENFNFLLGKKIDWNRVNTLIQEKRDSSFSFLESNFV